MIAQPKIRQNRPGTAAGYRDDGSTVPTPGDAPDGNSDDSEGIQALARPPPIGPVGT